MSPSAVNIAARCVFVLLLVSLLATTGTDSAQSAFDFNDFNTLESIYGWLTTLNNSCRPVLKCELYSIGESYEGRPIYLFKISKSGPGRRAYYIDSLTHAREWISGATLTNILNHLATGGDANAVRLTDQYDWYIVPVVNPDGYKYSWTNDRMWRKNRRPNYNLCNSTLSGQRSSCTGTDLNRNFNFQWGGMGSSNDYCLDSFSGPYPISEPETRAVASNLVRIGKTLLAMLTLHSYDQTWLIPWGYSDNSTGTLGCPKLPDDYPDLLKVAIAAANATQSTYNTTWTTGNSCQIYEPAPGATDDFSKGVAGVKYVYTAELRGDDFIIDKSNINPSFREMWNGIVAMCDTIKDIEHLSPYVANGERSNHQGALAFVTLCAILRYARDVLGQ